MVGYREKDDFWPTPKGPIFFTPSIPTEIEGNKKKSKFRMDIKNFEETHLLYMVCVKPGICVSWYPERRVQHAM